MLKTLNRILSFVIVFLLGFLSAVTLAVYFDVPTSKLDQLSMLIEARFIGEYDRTKTEDAAAAAMVASLGDRWSYYIPAADYAAFQERNDNAYVGIGITILPGEEGEGFRIVSVQENGPAKAAGLLPEDLIISANGQDIREMTTDELRDIIRGKEGTSVQLGILRDGQELSFEVLRAQILTDVVKYRMLEGNIGLIKILNFDSRCASDSIAAIEELTAQGAKALIFDVRNNPGGYAHELVALLDHLLPEGTIFHTLDYAGNESFDRSDADCLDIPMAVLCNEDSYSAAEFFAAAIQEYEAGTILGTPTCGKGYFQSAFPLMDGSAVGLSIGKYFTPKGNSLTGIGIQPDILVDVDDEIYAKIYYETLEPEEDLQVQAAVEVLLQDIRLQAAGIQ